MSPQQLKNGSSDPVRIFYDLVDDLVSRQVPLTQAMIIAGNKLQHAQQETRLFDVNELSGALNDIYILLKRRPDFDARASAMFTENPDDKPLS